MIAARERGNSFRPRVVLAHSDANYAFAARRHLEMLGWEIYRAGSGTEARRLAQELNPALVVLSVEGSDESGWLTCNKLVLEQPGRTVVLVTKDIGPEDHAFAGFVGAAALVSQRSGPGALADAMLETALSATEY
jgi:DNA-binding response OmpR family regulator